MDEQVDIVQKMLEPFNDPLKLSDEKTVLSSIFNRQLTAIIDAEWLDKAMDVLKMSQLKPCLMLMEFIGRIPVMASVFQNIVHSIGPCVLEKGSDARVPLRMVAMECFFAWYVDILKSSKTHTVLVLKKELEDDIVKLLSGKNPKGKEFGVLILSKLLKESDLKNQIMDFCVDTVPVFVGLLNDSVELVRKMAKDALLEIWNKADDKVNTVIRQEFIDQNVRQKVVEFFKEKKADISFKEAENEVQKMIEIFKGKETEQNWQKRETMLKWFQVTFCHDGQRESDDMIEVNGKYLVDALLQSSLSLRTSLSLSGLSALRSFIHTFSIRIIDSVAEQMVNGLFKTCFQLKKIVAVEVSNVFQELFQKTTHGIRFIPQIYALIDDKNVHLRDVCIKILIIIIQRFKKESIEKAGHFGLIEKCLDKGLTDAQAHIREQHRDLYFLYQSKWPIKAKRYLDHLEPSVVKAIVKHSPKITNIAQENSAVHKFNFADLKSEDPKDWIVGLENIVKYQNHESATGNVFSADECSKISVYLSTFFESENEMVLKSIASTHIIQYLYSLNALHLQDFLGPILDLVDKPFLSQSEMGDLRSFITEIEQSHTNSDLMSLILSSFKNPNIPNFGKTRGRKIKWILSVNLCLMTWIQRILTEKEGWDVFFSKYSTIQLCLSKLIPLTQFKEDAPKSSGLVLDLIKVIYGYNSQGVIRSLETFDSQISKLVYERINPVSEETFLVEDEKSNVFDETLPVDFADNTFQLTEERKDESEVFFEDQISFRQSPELGCIEESLENDMMDSENVDTFDTQSMDKTPGRPSGLLGSVERDDDYVFTKKYYNVVKLFRDETPKAVRHEERMDFLLESLSGDVSQPSLIRRLFRISREYVGELYYEFWNEWFLKVLNMVLSMIENCENSEVQENFIVLLKELILHQNIYFEGHETRVLKILIECRSNASNIISGTANDAITTAVQTLNPQEMISSLICLCNEWSEGNQTKPNLMNESQYRPLPLTSGLYFLGKLLGDHPTLRVSSKSVIDLSIPCLNHSQSEIRKGAIDTLVGLYKIMGDSIWRNLDDLNEMQRKLLKSLIYSIERNLLKFLSLKMQEKDQVLFVESPSPLNDQSSSANASNDETSDPQSAFNEETGEINWDCPCLGPMTQPPCGDTFKAAFSCFVYSKQEPKGSECVELFRNMQECFNKHPEIYGAEEEK